MYGQMTAGSWIYIATQGILQGTFETFAAIATKRFGGTLAGTITLTGGCGGMGGAQSLAVTLNDGVCLIVDVDRTRLERRVAKRYCHEIADDLDDAIARANALPTAFQASVFAGDIDVALRAADRLDASAVMVNDPTTFRTDWMPFAGRRTSGYGTGGIGYTLRDMTQEKMVVLRRG